MDLRSMLISRAILKQTARNIEKFQTMDIEGK